MSIPLNQVLDQRSHRITSAQRSRHFAVSLAGHGLVIAFFLLMPIFLAKPPEPFDYVAVTVVPPKALGVEDPPPQRPDPPPKKKEAPPPPPPPPKKEPPKVEPDRPVLATQPKEEAPKPPPKAEPKPAPKTPAPPASPLADPPKRKGNPLGNPLGASTTEATLGVEDPNFTYGYYLDRIVSMISQNWNRPPVGGEVKDALIYFRILRDGTVEQLTLKRSSGDEVFDRTAMGAVKATSPLPPLPKGYKRDFLGINLIVK